MRTVGGIARIARHVALALGLLVALSGRSEAQWGYGYGAGYGYGGWGWGGYGGFGSMGMSLYDQAMVKEQAYMNNAARFNLQNAQAEQSYQAANLIQQRALNTALENQRLAYQLAKEKYDVRSREASSYQAAMAAHPPVPIDRLIDEQGNVLWPDYAPSGGAHGERRAQADAAIRAVYLGSRGGSPGVRDVVEADRRLHEYGEPALSLLRTRGDARARAQLVDFLNALEVALNNLGSGQPASKEK